VIAVVHLVWGPLGPSPLRRFLASYRTHAPGAEHELVALFNGVSADQRPRLEAELEGTEHRLLELREPLQDLAAYVHVAGCLPHERLCFLNSHSVILETGWLAKLEHAFEQPGVGMVGATGSWASVRSGVMHSLFLPNPYRGVLPEKSVARHEFRAIELEQRTGGPAEGEPPERSLARSVWATLRTFPAMPEQLLRFESFPAYHVRTNAFMIGRRTFAGLQTGRIERKRDAYVLESGRQSFTRQIQRRGLRTLVVARDGSFFDRESWPAGRTFWQGDQEGLMIADNQTRSYANGGMNRRRLLSTFAWGRQADPCPPPGRQTP